MIYTISDAGGIIFVTVTNIDDSRSDLRTLLDDNLSKIVFGTRKISLEETKIYLREHLESKSREQKMGIVAELFALLHMMEQDYKQEYLMRNLEDSSMKKGFDGHFTRNGSLWLMESKSGSSTTTNHRSKINEAIGDLRKKIESPAGNNPWENAYNHSSHQDLDTEDSLREILDELSRARIKGVAHSITNFNVIPCATVFYGQDEFPDRANIIDTAKEIAGEIGAQKVHIFCCSYKLPGLFTQYLKD